MRILLVIFGMLFFLMAAYKAVQSYNMEQSGIYYYEQLDLVHNIFNQALLYAILGLSFIVLWLVTEKQPN